MIQRGPEYAKRTRRTRKAARRAKPAVTLLEGRALLSTFTVTSTADDGSTGTLRWAIGQANAGSQADSIAFSSLFNSPQTITLTGGALALTGSAATTITGPGADLLTVSGGGTSGVFVISGASATISDMTITGGSAAVGAGVRNDGGTLALADVTVRGNDATDRGGGVATRFGGSTTLLDSTVSGNTAVNGGGGLIAQSATLSVTNATITGNAVSSSSGVGGGIESDSATTTLVNDTITANTASTAGGLAAPGVPANATNTIVAGNTGGDTSGIINGGNNVIGGDPKLGALGDYGGPTLTMPPLPGSPAIGAGTSTGAPTTDQRGQPRGTSIDAGAFASQLVIPVNTPIDGVGSAPGQMSLRQAVNLANVLTSEDAIVFSSAFHASAQTITLTGGPIVLTDRATTTIVGPGASLLTLSGNKAGRVIELNGGGAAIQGLTITDGVAAQGGGVWSNGGTLVLTDSVITGNQATAGNGGGLLASNGTTTLNNVTFSGNLAAGSGSGSGGTGGFGGALATSGTATMTGCTLTGNKGVYGGGAMNLGGSMTLDNCTVSNNVATGPVGDPYGGGLGGGIDSATGTLAMSGCTITGNRSLGVTSGGNNGLGGGVYAGSYGAAPTTNATNCTITGNSAVNGGGGMDLMGGSAKLVNCTITGNSGTGQVGATDLTMLDGISATVINTIVGGISGNYGGSSNLIGGAPGLTALGYFGGPTMTMAPLPGSPAIGKGTTAGAPATDQRGLPRSGSVDIGAYQTQPGLVVNTTVDGNLTSPGQLDLRQAINLANSLPSDDTITFSSLFNTPQTIALTGGQLVIDDRADTTVTGTGANMLSISGGGTSRVFAVYGGTATFSNLTISGGRANYGGGLRNIGGTVALNDCTISGNNAFGQGQGATQSGGGGLYLKGGTLTLTGCTVAGNSSYSDGGGVAVYEGTATLIGCTISGNDVTGGGGGGVFNAHGTEGLTNCTISGNRAISLGGGLYCISIYGLSLTNCTVTGNFGKYGGGIYSGGSQAAVANTIIAGNSASGGGNDVTGSGGIGGSHNLIGGNPLLAPLGNYGGPTPTMPLLPGSPAIGAGTATGAPTVDQRGESRSGHVDIGAFQSQGFTLTPAPGSNAQSTPVGSAFANPLTVIVTANNPVEPVDGGVVSYAVTPVGGAAATLSAVSATITNGRASVTATANGTPGTYIVTASATGAASTGLALINTEKPSLTVTTTRDAVNAVDGLTSLREAIAYANSHPGPDTIILGPGLLGPGKHVIRLTGGPLILNDPATTTIIGPGAKRVTIRGDGHGSVFQVEGGSLVLEGLTISGGRAARGGGVLNQGGRLVLDHVVLRGNHARLGGGVYSDGRTILNHVRLGGNTARVGAGMFTARKAILDRTGASGRSAAPAAEILSDNVNGIGAVPMKGGSAQFRV